METIVFKFVNTMLWLASGKPFLSEKWKISHFEFPHLSYMFKIIASSSIIHPSSSLFDKIFALMIDKKSRGRHEPRIAELLFKSLVANNQVYQHFTSLI